MASHKGNSEKSEMLTPIWEDLVEGLQYVEHIAEELQRTGRLSRFKAEEILHSNKTRTEWNRGLLSDIQRTGAYDVFAKCLLVTGQEKLYQHVVSTVNVQSVTDKLTTLQYRVYCKDGKGDPKKIQVPPHIQQLLETHRNALQRMENVETLVKLMEEEGCLTSEIKQQPGNEGKVNMLVDRVKESMLYSYFALTKFLDISQQEELMLKISEDDTKTALGRMDDLLRHIFYNLLGAIALKHSELEERLGVKARDFVSLSINRNSVAVDRRGLNETHVDQSPGSEIKLTELFSGTENNKPIQKVLFIGAPGAGKTTAVMELARQATVKKTPNIPRPPFVIQLRKVNWQHGTTLKNLLLHYGPSLPATEQDKIWHALTRNPKEITIFLDGADEVRTGFFSREPAPVTGAETQASPKDILNNLISGKLLEGARILVSSRPHNLASCWDNFDRKVDVSGFNEKSLTRFLQNELPPQHLTEVQSFLKTHADIRSLLLIPLHAATFVLRAKSTKDTKDLLLESSTELSLSLIDSLVKTKLHKVHGTKIPEEHLEKQGENLLNICKLIAQLLCSEGAIKTEMTRKDLKKKTISVEECVATGVFIEQVLDEDDVFKRILMVHHQSILESLAALGLEEQQILKLVADNDGRHDLVLTYVAGILGNDKNRKMLEYVLIEEDQEKDFKKLAETVVRAILGSKRRLLPGGEEFCQRIVVESQQWDLIADLMRVMGRRWLVPDDTEALMLADQLVQHDPRGDTDDPLVRVEVRGISAVRYCPRATALRLSDCGLSSDDVAAATSSCRRLLHLDISGNRGVRGGDVRSRKLTGLDVSGCGMEGEELVDLAETNGETLTYLNATYGIFANPVLTSSHINALLACCPHLVEMYTDGGELVQALSVRRAACRLNHLWLGWCNLSSSSSSGDHVNSSELSDVITRHSSISTLTLYECYFTPDYVMSHLSSSMAAITKLYISPHPPRHDDPPPRPSDVASLVRASHGLKQLWLDGVHDVWRASDYMTVIDAINASPALCVVGLDVEKFTVDEVRVVVRAMTRPLTRLWLRVAHDRNREEMEDYAEVVLEPGVVQLVASLYDTYMRESGSFLQHLPPSLPDDL